MKLKTPKHLIAQASINENGQVQNGEFGDQTGCELNCRTYVDNAWVKIFRAWDDNHKEMIADFMEKAVGNGHIGYTQPNRSTLFNNLKEIDFKVEELNVLCGCDCSSLVYCAIYKTIKIPYVKEDGTEKIPVCAEYEDYIESVCNGYFESIPINREEEGSVFDNVDFLERGDILLKLVDGNASNHVVVFI